VFVNLDVDEPGHSGYGRVASPVRTRPQPSREGDVPTTRSPQVGEQALVYERLIIIVDDNDQPVPIGEIGEIVVRPTVSGAIFSGYSNNTQATVDSRRNLWHHTGDLGRLNENGLVAFLDSNELLTYVDRKKDSRRRRGENALGTRHRPQAEL
jgi:acyl-CoA synthetase (AMP-forming)/AMP-acid ligase II